MPLIVQKEYTQQTYSFIKGGDLMSKVKKQSGFKELNEGIIVNNIISETFTIFIFSYHKCIISYQIVIWTISFLHKNSLMEFSPTDYFLLAIYFPTAPYL